MRRRTQNVWIENEGNVWGRLVFYRKYFVGLIQRYGDVYDMKIIRRKKEDPELEFCEENLIDVDEAKELCEKKIDYLIRFASY